MLFFIVIALGFLLLAGGSIWQRYSRYGKYVFLFIHIYIVSHLTIYLYFFSQKDWADIVWAVILFIGLICLVIHLIVFFILIIKTKKKN